MVKTKNFFAYAYETSISTHLELAEEVLIEFVSPDRHVQTSELLLRAQGPVLTQISFL